MDESKMFDLLEKIYVEVQETKSDISGIKEGVSILKEDVSNLKQDVSILKKEVRRIGIQIDEEIIPVQRALLDGYQDNSEKISILDDKVDRLQMDVNIISAKTAFNDNRIIEISKNFKNVK